MCKTDQHKSENHNHHYVWQPRKLKRIQERVNTTSCRKLRYNQQKVKGLDGITKLSLLIYLIRKKKRRKNLNNFNVIVLFCLNIHRIIGNQTKSDSTQQPTEQCKIKTERNCEDKGMNLREDLIRLASSLLLGLGFDWGKRMKNKGA